MASADWLGLGLSPVRQVGGVLKGRRHGMRFLRFSRKRGHGGDIVTQGGGHRTRWSWPAKVRSFMSTPHFHTVHDLASGSTSLLSFVSDAAVFPDPLFWRDCGFDSFCPSAGGSHRAMAECRPHPGMFAGPCCCRYPQTATGCQPAPEQVHEIVQQQHFRDYGKSQHTSGTRLHP